MTKPKTIDKTTAAIETMAVEAIPKGNHFYLTSDLNPHTIMSCNVLS